MKDPERFRTWVYAVGGSILGEDNDTILKLRRICHDHFEPRYHTRSKRISANAIPTINLPGKLECYCYYYTYYYDDQFGSVVVNAVSDPRVAGSISVQDKHLCA